MIQHYMHSPLIYSIQTKPKHKIHYCFHSSRFNFVKAVLRPGRTGRPCPKEEGLAPRVLELLRLVPRHLVRVSNDVYGQPPQGGGAPAKSVHHGVGVGLELNPLAPLLTGLLHHCEVLGHHQHLTGTDLSVEDSLPVVVHDLDSALATGDVEDAVGVHEPVWGHDCVLHKKNHSYAQITY